MPEFRYGNRSGYPAPAPLAASHRSRREHCTERFYSIRVGRHSGKTNRQATSMFDVRFAPLADALAGPTACELVAALQALTGFLDMDPLGCRLCYVHEVLHDRLTKFDQTASKDWRPTNNDLATRRTILFFNISNPSNLKTTSAHVPCWPAISARTPMSV